MSLSGIQGCLVFLDEMQLVGGPIIYYVSVWSLFFIISGPIQEHPTNNHWSNQMTITTCTVQNVLCIFLTFCRLYTHQDGYA